MLTHYETLQRIIKNPPLTAARLRELAGRQKPVEILDFVADELRGLIPEKIQGEDRLNYAAEVLFSLYGVFAGEAYDRIRPVGDFGAWIHDPEFSDFIKRVDGEVGKANVQTQINVLWQLVSVERAGGCQYQIDPHLARALRVTEIRGLKTDDVQTPKPAIYIDVPAEAGLRVWNFESGWHRLVGLYLTCWLDPTAPLTRQMRFLCVGEDKNGGGYFGINTNDALSFFTVKFEPNKAISEALFDAELEFVAFGTHENWGEMRGEWLQIFHWTVNLLLYLTNAHPGEHWICNREARALWERIQKLPPGKKREKLKARFKELDPQRRILVGHLDRSIQRDLPAKSDANGSGISPVVGVVVSGHWKRQACGVKRQDRRLIWVAPYWRGPELVQIFNRKVVVSAGKEKVTRGAPEGAQKSPQNSVDDTGRATGNASDNR